MTRLLMGWLTLNVYAVVALTIFTHDWRKRNRSENHDELVERMELNRQRLAETIASAMQDEYTNAPTVRRGRREHRSVKPWRGSTSEI